MRLSFVNKATAEVKQSACRNWMFDTVKVLSILILMLKIIIVIIR